MAEAVVERSTVWGRLESVEEEYKKLEEERDTALLERDKARLALVPILEQVERLRETVLAQLPKADKRLPSARGYSVTPEMVDGWVEQYEGGMSVTRIAEESDSKPATVTVHLKRRGVEIRGRRRFDHGGTVAKPKGKVERVPRCRECNLPLDSPALTNGNVPPPVDGVCGLCQFIARDLAERRRGNGHGQALGAGPTMGESV